MGFINQYQEDGLGRQEDLAYHHIYTRMKPSLEMGHKKNSQHLKLRANSNCWICEGWSEFFFEFRPPEKIDPLTVPVKLHISTDDYEGEILVLDKEKSRLESSKIDKG